LEDRKSCLQIHVAGAKRSGKTTLAKGIFTALRGMNLRPVLVDVDDVKHKIFGNVTAAPDSEESLRIQGWTLSAMFDVIVPAVLTAHGTPIVAATHSNHTTYANTKRISEDFGSSLKFLLLEAPTLEEAALRAQSAGASDLSDMKDFSNPLVRKSFVDAARRVEESYADVKDSQVFRLKQGSPDSMVGVALEFILRESG